MAYIQLMSSIESNTYSHTTSRGLTMTTKLSECTGNLTRCSVPKCWRDSDLRTCIDCDVITCKHHSCWCYTYSYGVVCDDCINSQKEIFICDCDRCYEKYAPHRAECTVCEYEWEYKYGDDDFEFCRYCGGAVCESCARDPMTFIKNERCSSCHAEE